MRIYDGNLYKGEPMHPDHKKILRAVSLELRHTLEGQYDDGGRFQPGDLERRLNEIGLWRDRPAKPLAELPHLSSEDRQARQVVDAYLEFRQEAGVSHAEAVVEFVREGAYTWANRLLTLRCMEARGIIDEVILQKEVYGWRSMVHNRFARRNPAACAGEDDGLFAVLLAEFAERAAELPTLFNPKVPAIALQPSIPALKRCIALLSGRESARSQPAASDEVFAAPDALGWAYQYWNAEEKDRVFEKVRTQKGAKIEGADIIPATQLYTEPYMVKFLVQNSLGATWLLLHPESRLAENWEYYVKDADRTPAAGGQGSSGAGVKSVSEITFLDPAAGSGHFLLEAFDLFYQMYEEEAFTYHVSRITSSEQICASILNNNLFGIDIDERAIQIAQAALWMKAKEYAPDLSPADLFPTSSSHLESLLSPAPLPPSPPAFFDHLIATNIRLPRGKDHLEAFLRQHPEDRDLRPALETVFEGLANAHELGSLLQIEEPVEKELRYLQAKAEERRGKPEQLGMFAEYIQPKQGELPLGVESYEEWKARTLARLNAHFEAEAEAADLSRAFFGQVVGKGLALFDLLAHRYDVVAANPPYMGSKNMRHDFKSYIAKNYAPAKHDTYAAFIIRCLELVKEYGRVAMVTQQSWLYLRSYINLRAGEIEKSQKLMHLLFQGLLRSTTVEMLVHLGPRAFSEISGEVVNSILFVLSNYQPDGSNKIFAIQLTEAVNAEEKKKSLQNTIAGNYPTLLYHPLQSLFLKLPDAQLVYQIADEFVQVLQDSRRLDSIAEVKPGPQTSDNLRFNRCFWEYSSDKKNRWYQLSKGGGFKRWIGLNYLLIEWQDDGIRVKEYNQRSGDHWSRNVRNVDYVFRDGISYSAMGNHFSARLLSKKEICDTKGPGIYVSQDHQLPLLAFLNTHLTQYLLKLLSPSLDFNPRTISALPLPKQLPAKELVEFAITVKHILVSTEQTEYEFLPKSLLIPQEHLELLKTLLHHMEGYIEGWVTTEFNLSKRNIGLIISQTGTPVGWYPLIVGYDQLFHMPTELPQLPSELSVSFETHQRNVLPVTRLVGLKSRLRNFYESGPGIGVEDLDVELLDDEIDENGDMGARVPIPPETFLEELSVKLQIHPISVYWLIKEGREKEGWRCRPEEKRLTEDRFTVLVLRLLGHRWPKQIEAGEPVPAWADADGIIPLNAGTDQPLLLDRVRERLAVEFPRGSIAAIEREFAEIVGESLEKWLTGSFFKRHISQFKKRPIAWQLVSRGAGGRGSKGEPAFACLVYYHKLDGDLLPKLRTQYVGPLRSRYETELRTLERLEHPSPDQAGRKLQLESWISELKSFEETLNRVTTYGFGPDNLPALNTRLRQLAVDEAVLSLKGRWLERLAGVIRSGPLAGWQETARAAHLSPDLPTWIADALTRLDYACTQVGPASPLLASLPPEPGAADLSRVICQDSRLLVEQTLAVICGRWWATFEQKLIAPLRNQIQFVLDRAVDAKTAEATVKRLKKEIEDITTRGRQVEKQILAWRYPDADELAAWLADQPLFDAISSLDSRRSPPSTVTDFVRQESAYVPDLNDGVRVNIAPLQRAGLLSADVLARKDLDPALADRAEWRADERRWCREGKLPRPGWWE